MDEVFIRTWTLPEWLVKKYYKGKDFVSIDELITTIEDLDSDRDMIEEEFEDYKQYVEDNYKFIGEKEAVGYDEKTW